MIKIWVSGCCYLCRFKWDVFLKSRINVNWTLKFRQNSTMELFFEIYWLFWFFFGNHSLFILERFSNLSANRVHSVLFHLKTMSFVHVVTFPFSNLMFNMSSLIFLVNSIRFASFIGFIFFSKEHLNCLLILLFSSLLISEFVIVAFLKSVCWRAQED